MLDNNREVVCLLTGANGFLGKILENHLAASLCVKTSSRSQGDYICDLENTVPQFKEKFNIVIHSAGLAHNVNVKKNHRDFWKVNVFGTRNLLIGLERTGTPDQFIYISSVSVYGKQSGDSISEKCELMAKDAYGRSKLETENLVIDWCKKNNVTCTILRLPLVVGENPPGNLGEMINAIKSNRYFNVAGGKSKKSMVLAQDVAKFILKAADIGGTYNLTDGYHPSVYELSKNIAQQLGKPVPYNLPMVVAKVVARVGNAFGRRSPINTEKLLKITSNLTFDDVKARETFGWDPTPVLEGFKIVETD